MPVIDDAAAPEACLAEASCIIAATGSGGDTEAASAGEATEADAVMQESGGSSKKLKGENPAAVLARLRGEAQRMKQERKVLMKNLKNARRQNQRLKKKASKLNDEELLQIMAMRNGVAAVAPPVSHENASRGGGRSSQDSAPEACAAASDGSADAGRRDIDFKRLASRMEL